jgi:hypothetical protein
LGARRLFRLMIDFFPALVLHKNLAQKKKKKKIVRKTLNKAVSTQTAASSIPPAPVSPTVFPFRCAFPASAQTYLADKAVTDAATATAAAAMAACPAGNAHRKMRVQSVTWSRRAGKSELGGWEKRKGREPVGAGEACDGSAHSTLMPNRPWMSSDGAPGAGTMVPAPAGAPTRRPCATCQREGGRVVISGLDVSQRVRRRDGQHRADRYGHRGDLLHRLKGKQPTLAAYRTPSSLTRSTR